MKHKAQITYLVKFKHEKRWVGKAGTLYLGSRIGGGKSHRWYVKKIRNQWDGRKMK